jgi:ABC-type lipoprotein export system ATPase subunit
MPDTLIKLENITKVYAGAQPVYALRGINMTVNKGEFISIVGPSGSGKSTLMNVLGLLDKPTDGKLSYFDEETSEWKDSEKALFRNEKIGFIFQAHLLLAEFNALENVLMPAYIGRNVNKEQKDRAEYILDRVGLSDKLYSRPAQLSGGQNQRVAIARALMNNPAVVFADEPTGALDQTTSGEIYNLFRQINSETEMAFVIVTHEPNLARKADRQITLVDGAIISDEKQVAVN